MLHKAPSSIRYNGRFYGASDRTSNYLHTVQIFHGKYISQVNIKGQGDRQAFPFNRKESIGIG